MVFHRKKKRFRLFVVPRYLPGSVTLQILYTDLARYNRHRYNVFLAKPKVDTVPPKMNPGLYLKTKKLIDDAKRINDVDQENRAILKKINLINRTKGLVDCWNKLQYSSSKKWITQQEKMKSIYLTNLHIYQSLNATESIYKRSMYLKDWERIVEKLEYGSKYPLVLLQEKTLDQKINELPSISHDLDKLCVRPTVFIEFGVKDGVSLGKVTVVLYSDYAPVTVQNFLSIIKNDDGLCYKNCPIHNCVHGKYFVTGDITKGNGKGGASIFGEKFDEESHTLLHTKPVIEHLPQELRDRFTEMRELDLSVQNNMDDIEKRVKVLFNEWKRNPNDLPPTADLEFEGIKKEYYKTLEDQDEKVVLANQMYELVDRYLRRLDTELHKFKCELEADNKGITELLEKRSLELDAPITSTTSSQKENRYERYTSSRPREKRRSDSCQSAGGVTYPEKRPHLAHSLSLSEQRHSVAATNGNNVLLASQLQQHVVQQGSSGLHAMTQSQQLATSNTTTTTTSPSPHHHSNSHHSPHHINIHPTIINSNNTTNNALINTGQQSLSASSHTLANLSATHPSISAAAAPTTTHHGQSMAMAAVCQSTTSHHHHHQQHGVGSSSVPVSAGSANGSGVIVGAAAVASSSLSAASGGGGGGGGGAYALVSGGAGPAIAAAASQAIAATQKMQQGRRTPSLKASYEAINSTGSGGLMKVNDLAIGRELAGAAQTAIQAIQHDSNKKKAKKYASSASHHSSSSSSSSSALRHSMATSSTASTVNQQSQHVDMSEVDSYVSGGGVDVGVSVDDMGGVGGGDDLPGANGEYIDSYDPNEPRYCLCNQVSYGDMVACDNEDCPSEWFHYPCVGITAPPKGKWYCPQCTSSMRRRGNRKN